MFFCVKCTYFSIFVFEGMVYVTLESEDNIFIFDCGAFYVHEYQSFGWKFRDYASTKSNIVTGSYSLKLYWNTPSTWSSIGENGYYELMTNGQITVNVTMYSQTEEN